MKRVCMLAISLLAVMTVSAIELPEIIGDNMMLQQNTSARLWGWAEKGHYVTVRTGWDNKSYTAQTDAEGRWEVSVQTPVASFEQYSMTFSEYASAPKKNSKAVDEKTINGVLAGEEIGRAHV